MFVAFSNVNFIFTPKVKKKKGLWQSIQFLFTPLYRKLACGSAMIKFSGAQLLPQSHVVRKYASRLLMGLPRIKVSILA